jgi:hypothetical protein
MPKSIFDTVLAALKKELEPVGYYVTGDKTHGTIHLTYVLSKSTWSTWMITIQ